MKHYDSRKVSAFQEFLKDRGLFFACAESCTGGLLSQEMTRRPGSSEVFWGGVVSYADEAKNRFLGVENDVLQTYGAVSGPVAEAMVRGLVHVSGVSLAVSLTGIAGPGGGSVDKPVGTVWFGISSRRDGVGWQVAVRHRFRGSRRQVQVGAARWARILATCWWESRMDLDSLQALTDNGGKSFVEAFQPPSSFF